MKTFLVLALVALGVTLQEKPGAQSDPRLSVVKFSCGVYEVRNSMIRSVQDSDPPNNEPIRITQTARNEPQEVINRRDMQERRAELRTAEINASLSTQRGSTLYFYRIEIKNTNEKVIKSFAWEYQPVDPADPSNRQFYCAVKAKPNENKQFELISPLAPTRIVDASKAGEKPDKGSKEKVVINRVEFFDGSIWQRPGWNPKTFSTEFASQVQIGKCIGL